jgi:signal transduction histidine kinase
MAAADRIEGAGSPVTNGRPAASLREVSAAVLAVTAHLSVREVLQTILTSARSLLNARYAALGVPDANGSFGEFLADGIPDEQWAAIGPVPRQHGLLGVLLRDPNPVRLADIRQHPQFGWWPAAHPVLTDFLGMPITDGEEILGELFLANKCEPGGFTEADEELLKLLAAHAAIALVNARLYERSRELSIVEERNRIARELHDSVAQKLFSLRLTAESATTLLASDAARAATELANVGELAGEVADELRAIVVGLRPVDLAGDGLHIALRKQIDLLDRVHGAQVRLRTDEPVCGLTAARQEAAYRIAQEAMHNALRHADAKRVDISLREEDDLVVLEVVDDGQGFDVPREQSAHRLGIGSMRERARSVGGRLTVSSAPGRGTTVRLEMPA